MEKNGCNKSFFFGIKNERRKRRTCLFNNPKNLEAIEVIYCLVSSIHGYYGILSVFR